MTSTTELYETLGAIIVAVTGREWWRSTGMQAQPRGVYATIYLVLDHPVESPVVENIEIISEDPNSEVFMQRSWGTTTIDCMISFYRDALNDSANDAAIRFRNSLHIEKRFNDIWRIAGLVGRVRVLDISGVFRADIEPRSEVRFSLMVNLSAPDPIEDNRIFDIQSQKIDLTHVKPDKSETEIIVEIDAPVQYLVK